MKNLMIFGFAMFISSSSQALDFGGPNAQKLFNALSAMERDHQVPTSKYKNEYALSNGVSSQVSFTATDDRTGVKFTLTANEAAEAIWDVNTVLLLNGMEAFKTLTCETHGSRIGPVFNCSIKKLLE